MRILINVSEADTKNGCTVYCDAPSHSPLKDILPSLKLLIGSRIPDESTEIRVDGKVVDPEQTLAELKVHKGSCITFVDSRSPNSHNAIPENISTNLFLPDDFSQLTEELLELRIICGKNAGEIYRFPARTFFIVTSSNSSLSINNTSSSFRSSDSSSHSSPQKFASIAVFFHPDTSNATVSIHPLLKYSSTTNTSFFSYDSLSFSYDSLSFSNEINTKKSFRSSLRDKRLKKYQVSSDIFINGKELLTTTSFPLETPIILGNHVIELARFNPSTIPVVVDSEKGVWLFSRPPKINPVQTSWNLKLPNKPAKPEKMPFPIVMSLLPLVAAIGMAYFFKNWTYLAFGLMSPLMILSSAFSGNYQSKQRWKRQIKEYKKIVHDMHIRAKELASLESQQRRQDFPSPAEVLEISELHNAHLWERRIYDENWLHLRLGLGTVISQTSLEDPTAPEDSKIEHQELIDSPIVVDLAGAGVIGISGNPYTVYPLIQWCILQMAALHSGRDLSLFLLAASIDKTIFTYFNESSLSDFLDHRWDFCQWIRHFQISAEDSELCTIGVTPQQTAARIAELTAILNLRLEETKNHSSQKWGGSFIVTILDNAHILRSQPGMIRLLEEGPRVGMLFICIDFDQRLLPEECTTVILTPYTESPYENNVSDKKNDVTNKNNKGNEKNEKNIENKEEDNENANHIIIRSNLAHNDQLEAIPDIISPRVVERIALALAPLQDNSPSANQANIPDSCNLLQELSLTPLPEEIQSIWRLTPRSTSFAIGEAMGKSFNLDISKDGPHALIGGTTGSGKSELLQSIIASLAVNNTPDEMNFVLIDYKGGAAFKDCTHLPHTVGMVTDLDNHLVKRALTSLSAELTRREGILGNAETKDLEDYIDARTLNPSLGPVPRLVLIIDEFASLIRDLPDFVSGLVNIAQRGRSLGIHLILATQKPSGVVSPEIRANTNLRIALRTTDVSESQDIIDAKDSAFIGKNTPGRAVARLSSNSLILFQSARVGGRHNATSAKNQEKIQPFLYAMSFTDLGNGTPQPPKMQSQNSVNMTTDLQVLIESITKASQNLGFLSQYRPWLPPLPTSIGVESITNSDSQDSTALHPSLLAVPFALGDFPDQQSQKPITFDLSSMGNLFIIGSARSGKSTTLKTIAYSLCKNCPLNIVHMHGIDAGNGALAPLTAFPHVGTIANRSDSQKIQRLITLIQKELHTRSNILSSQGFSSIDEYNRHIYANTTNENDAQPLFHIVFLIDSWNGFINAYDNFDSGRLCDAVLTLMKEGTAAGIHFIVSGEKELFSTRMYSLAENKVVLRLIDYADYSSIGLSPRDIPEKIPDGRGYLSSKGTEVQIAQILPNASGQEEAQAIRETGQKLQAELRGKNWKLPLTIEEIPEELSLETLYEKTNIPLPVFERKENGKLAPNTFVPSTLSSSSPQPEGGREILLGAGGDDNHPISYKTDQFKILPVVGGNKCGKTTFLKTVVLNALMQGCHCTIAAPKKSSLTAMADEYENVSLVSNIAALGQQELEHLIIDHPENFVLFDDSHLLLDIPAGEWLKSFIQTGDYENCGNIVAAINDLQGSLGFSSWVQEMRNIGGGIALQPTDMRLTDFIQTDFSRSYTTTMNIPGRALFNTGEKLSTLQIADSTSFIEKLLHKNPANN